MMKITELRQKSKEELNAYLGERRVRLDELGFLVRQNKIKNVKEIASVKKDVARIMTLLKKGE